MVINYYILLLTVVVCFCIMISEVIFDEVEAGNLNKGRQLLSVNISRRIRGVPKYRYTKMKDLAELAIQNFCYYESFDVVESIT